MHLKVPVRDPGLVKAPERTDWSSGYSEECVNLYVSIFSRLCFSQAEVKSPLD